MDGGESNGMWVLLCFFYPTKYILYNLLCAAVGAAAAAADDDADAA